jgi:hypothetical protein
MARPIQKVDAFDLCPEINIPMKTTSLYLGICQMTPKLFPKVFSLSGYQGFGSKSPDSKPDSKEERCEGNRRSEGGF